MDDETDQSDAAFPDDSQSAFGDVDKTASMNGQVQGGFEQQRSRRNYTAAIVNQAQAGRGRQASQSGAIRTGLTGSG